MRPGDLRRFGAHPDQAADVEWLVFDGRWRPRPNDVAVQEPGSTRGPGWSAVRGRAVRLGDAAAVAGAARLVEVVFLLGHEMDLVSVGVVQDHEPGHGGVDDRGVCDT